MILRNKNAGCGEHQQPATIVRQRPLYHPLQRRVKRPRIFPGRKDRRPPLSPARESQPPSPAPSLRPGVSSDGHALALLVLGLQDCRLPPRQQRRAWMLVDKWLREYVAAKHVGEAA